MCVCVCGVYIYIYIYMYIVLFEMIVINFAVFPTHHYYHKCQVEVTEMAGRVAAVRELINAYKISIRKCEGNSV